MNDIDYDQMNKVKSLRELFPLNPYDVQVNISQSIYKILQEQTKKLMIIQSPTGTGKSYSLLVPIVAWINQNKFKIKQKQQPQRSQPKIPSFLLKKQNTQESITENLKKQKQKALSQIVDIEEIAKLARFKFQRKQNYQDAESKEEMDVDELEGDEKQYDGKRKIGKEEMFMEREINLARKDVAVKLIFVSRTHSQLEQIVDSLNKILPKLDVIQGSTQLMSLTLGSKQHLCCNPSLSNPTPTPHPQSITQKCQHLLTTSTCPYTHSHLIRQFFNKSIKQATSLSSHYKLCGYYSLRNSISCADILLMPYASIVGKEIRQRIGVNVNNSVIVFDQGHNLVEFVRDAGSGEVWYGEVIVLIDKIQLYLAKYGDKMKCLNKTLLSHFGCVLRSIVKVMQSFYHEKLSKCNQQTYIKMTMIQLILQLDLTDIRLHKIKQLFALLDYDKKLAFFQPQPQPKVKTHQKQSNPKANSKKTISVADIHRIINWIQTLYRSDQNQMTVFVKSNPQTGQKNIQNVSIKLYCLYSNQLEELIEASRLTIIAGGTMQPLSNLEHITSKTPTQILKMPHIIKPDQCAIKCVLSYQKHQIKFNYENSNSQAGSKFLQQVILATLKKVVQKTPQEQGIIAFIQSYKLLETIKETLKLEPFFKDILFDSKNSRNENIFQIHAQKISSKQRSILFSVMGGKLSEGINFSDNLARKLIVFGLPYPSIKSPQIQEQMKYYDDLKLSSLNGQKYYESLCLKTINQTIGRGIRHKDDWAEIFLVDQRFLTLKEKLAEWMKPSISVVQSLESL